MSTRRVHFLRCTECDWHGSRDERETLDVCPSCGAEVEGHGPKSRTYGEPTTDELGIIRPCAERLPFGLPRSHARRVRPWHDGHRILPNGLRAKVVRMPTIADALDDAAQHRSDVTADIAAASGWNHEDT